MGLTKFNENWERWVFWVGLTNSVGLIKFALGKDFCTGRMGFKEVWTIFVGLTKSTHWNVFLGF